MKGKLLIGMALILLILSLSGCSWPVVVVKTPSISSAPAVAKPAHSPASTTAPRTSTSPALSALAGSDSDSPLALETLLETIYAQVNGSVVNIQVIEKTASVIPDLSGLLPTPGNQYSRALGSGFVWDLEGHIVTNNHVVAGAQSISVTFPDGSIYAATVTGTDPDSDLAVIKVEVPAHLLSPVSLADSTQLKVGQLAIAIGNPFGLQGTMTIGFISGLGRLLPSDENAVGPSYSIPEIIQTDAPINPGNSGGVLLNKSGQVIGVPSAIATQSGSSSGVGFAIPSAIVQNVVPRLIENGRYEHPWLGVSVITLNPDINKAMNLDSNQRGALVAQVMAGSPAEKAGLIASQRQITVNGYQVSVGGDIITALGSHSIKSSDDLVTVLSESGSIGQTVTFTLLRDGKEIQVAVKLEARPGQQ